MAYAHPVEAGVLLLDGLELFDYPVGRAGQERAAFNRALNGGQARGGSAAGVADVADLLVGEASGQTQRPNILRFSSKKPWASSIACSTLGARWKWKPTLRLVPGSGSSWPARIMASR